MYSKIAFRNVKRQIGNYCIYFITVALTVSMLFSMYNFLLSKQMIDFAHNIKDLQVGWIGITIFLAIFVSIILGYATSHMLKLRKREFGTYMTLGMNRKNVMKLFVTETFFISFLALAVGIFVGLFLFQGVIGVSAKIMEIDIIFAKYSVGGFFLTIVVVAVMFILSAISSIIYLKKVSIYELLHAEEKNKKATKHPYIWLIITVIAFSGIIVSGMSIYDDILTRLKTGDENDNLLIWLLVVIITVIVFHIGLAKSIVTLMIKNKKFKSKGTRTFVLRQLSSELNANAVLCGFMALLMVAAVACTNICFAQKSSLDNELSHSNPFDISVNLTQSRNAPYTHDEAKETINKYNTITDTITYDIYTSGTDELYKKTPWTGDGFEGITDYYIKESDFNKILSKLGYEEVLLEHEIILLTKMCGTSKEDFSDTVINLGGKDYTIKDVTEKYPVLSDGYMVAAVPDEAVADMKVEINYEVMDLKNKRYDAQSLYDELKYKHEEEGYSFKIETCNYDMREYNRINSNSMVAVVMVGELFGAMMLVFLTLAILILKLLSCISQDRKKYKMLYCMGVNEKEQKKVLFWQLFFFFFLPYFIPMLISIPMAYGIGNIVKMWGFTEAGSEIYGNAFGIGSFITIVYVVYFIATYIVQKRKVI